MLRSMKRFLLALPFLSLPFALPWFPLEAASPFKQSVSAQDLASAYAEASAEHPLRILVVPGHEPGAGGAEFGGLYERELAVDLANRLKDELSGDPRLEVLVARGDLGWSDDLVSYFDRSMRSIRKFVDAHKKEMAKLLKRGKVEEKTEEVAHATAAEDAALRLYGITKWANENDVDLMLHVHFNDDAAHAPGAAGAQSGFAIYVPDGQYGNAEASRAVAAPVLAELARFSATSTLPLEDAGIVEDQELIALGANNTSEVPSLLVEYGYLYEDRFAHEETRPSVLADLARGTARGIERFFGGPLAALPATRALPHSWTYDVTATTTTKLLASADAYALQAALRSVSAYPAATSTLSACPVSGAIGPCTVAAIKEYQRAHGLEATGTLGPRTRGLLNAQFGR
jgi:N-acetylmuramoyl-L-alanine amidase